MVANGLTGTPFVARGRSVSRIRGGGEDLLQSHGVFIEASADNDAGTNRLTWRVLVRPATVPLLTLCPLWIYRANGDEEDEGCLSTTRIERARE